MERLAITSKLTAKEAGRLNWKFLPGGRQRQKSTGTGKNTIEKTGVGKMTIPVFSF